MGSVVKFPRHAAASRKKASIGTLPPESSLSRLASASDASRRPAKMFRKCEFEQSAADAMSAIDSSLRCAQRSMGCEVAMNQSVSTRNIKSQPKIFLTETPLEINGLVKWGMARKATPPARELFLGDWMTFFAVGPVALAKVAHCSHSYISNMAGERRGNVNALYLLAISEELGITVNALFTRPPPKTAMQQLEGYDQITQAAILARASRRP